VFFSQPLASVGPETGILFYFSHPGLVHSAVSRSTTTRLPIPNFGSANKELGADPSRPPWKICRWRVLLDNTPTHPSFLSFFRSSTAFHPHLESRIPWIRLRIIPPRFFVGFIQFGTVRSLAGVESWPEVDLAL